VAANWNALLTTWVAAFQPNPDTVRSRTVSGGIWSAKHRACVRRSPSAIPSRVRLRVSHRLHVGHRYRIADIVNGLREMAGKVRRGAWISNGRLKEAVLEQARHVDPEESPVVRLAGKPRSGRTHSQSDRPPSHPCSGGGPVEPRTTSLIGSSMRRSAFSPASRIVRSQFLDPNHNPHEYDCSVPLGTPAARFGKLRNRLDASWRRKKRR
jgi:hypothetical protein